MKHRCRASEAGSVEAGSSISKSIFFLLIASLGHSLGQSFAPKSTQPGRPGATRAPKSSQPGRPGAHRAAKSSQPGRPGARRAAKSRQPGRPGARRAPKSKQPGRHRRNTAPVQRNRRFAAQGHAFRAAKSSQQGPAGRPGARRPGKSSQPGRPCAFCCTGPRFSRPPRRFAAQGHAFRAARVFRLVSSTALVEEFRY